MLRVRKGSIHQNIQFFILEVVCLLIFLHVGTPLYGGDNEIEIIERSDLRFPTIISNSDNTNVTVAPEDAGAAVFDARGEPYQVVRVTVKHSHTYMDIVQQSGSADSGGKRVELIHFSYGGSLTERGGGGTGIFDASGNLTNIRIGATAKIPSPVIPGNYRGQIILRIIYQ